MEFEQTFRQGAVIQSGCFEQGGYHCFIVAVFDQSGNIFSVDTLAGYIQVVIESKILDSVEECLFELGSRPVIVGGQELEQVLEHTTRCTGGGNELYDSLICVCICIPGGQISLLFFCIGS